MSLDPWAAIRLSLAVGVSSALVGLLPAVGLAWLLARGRFRGKALLSAVLLIPLVLPPVVTGFLMLEAFGRSSLLGAALEGVGLRIPFSFVGAVAAAWLVGLPLYVMAIRGAFEAVDPRLEEVSWTLGVRPLSTWLRVTVPLALPGIAAGLVLAFARGLGEFGATAVLAGNIEGETRTIALAVYSLLEATDGEERLRLLLGMSIALSLVALVGYEALNRWQRRRLELDRE